jgi:hypothetical protein
MNKAIKILVLIAALATTAAVANVQSFKSNSQQAPVSLQLFYDQLSPYGTWVSYRDYGYAWIPNAGPDFYPYATEGHWVFTDIGWTWYSNYSWGWAPFHYGRWSYDDYYGWLWVPDTEWSPAWVMWRSGGGYYGWAPLEPRISIDAVFGGGYRMPGERWTFVRDRDIDNSKVYSHSVNRTSNTTIINNTTLIQHTRSDKQRNVTYIAGPEGNDVQKIKGKPVRQVVVQEHTKPGQDLTKRNLRTYKPQIQRDEDLGRKTSPAKIEGLNNVRPISERYKGQPQRKSNSGQLKSSPGGDGNRQPQPSKNKSRSERPDKKKGKD